jgi:hypothetical protein
MPEISRFYGIVVRMYHNDHSPPHFHAIYGSHEALVDIATPKIIAGTLPSRAAKLVLEWANLHHPELMTVWDQARRMAPLDRIDPLP